MSPDAILQLNMVGFLVIAAVAVSVWLATLFAARHDKTN